MITVSLFEQLAKSVLDYYFKSFKAEDNTRPLWTKGLEIDRLYPQLGIAIEFQGPQHYRQISSMQTDERFKEQLKADSLKRTYCLERGILLLPLSIYDFTEASYKQTVNRIKTAGLIYSRKNNDHNTYNILYRMLVGGYFDPQIFRRIEGIKNKKPEGTISIRV